jgi:D-alanine-D-alanine ligase-like ATP-grasp enzyme
MEWVDVDREFRVHVFNGKSIRVSEKDFLDEDRKQYLTIKPTVDRRRHIRDAAKEAVAALGLDFGTVDVLADDEQAFVLEVNAAPGLGGSTPRLWAEAFINWKESQ